ncbi:posterior protein [Tachysurus fulvidraco]|uniref:posterior protein n=1 Tax=Tachysurus fulvidraco TaxID=1234273 RepID=UPI000F4E95B4|nr:posterior protein [Tachysurus fulvidraco]XP_027000599.1 posterior protein [Tachysurus fulvidraco]
MEQLIVKYIAKHGSQGMFDGIENIVDKPYEWAISKFENYPKMPKNKKGQIANALQAVLASYKVTNKTLNALKAENEQLQSRLDDGIISKRDHQMSEILWKEEKIRMQSKIVHLRTNNSMLSSSVETLFKDLEEAKSACQFLLKNGTTEISTGKTSLCGMWSNQVPDMLDSDGNSERDPQSVSSQHSDCTVKFPMTPVHLTTTMPANEEEEEPMTSTMVRGFNPNELEVIKSIGKFDPAKQDPLDFLKVFELYADIYKFTDGDACVLLTVCLPDTLSGALKEKVKTRTANKLERKQALLEVLGVMSVDWDKISDVHMRTGEHPMAFSERLLETFKTFSGNPDITPNDVSFKSALINKCDSLTRSAVSMFVTHLSDYNDIIAKMTQFFNNNANSKRSHYVSAVGVKNLNKNRASNVSWKKETYTTGGRKERLPPRNPDNPLVCYSCGKEGHISRECKFSLKRSGPKTDLHQLQATVNRLRKELKNLWNSLPGIFHQTTQQIWQSQKNKMHSGQNVYHHKFESSDDAVVKNYQNEGPWSAHRERPCRDSHHKTKNRQPGKRSFHIGPLIS